MNQFVPAFEPFAKTNMENVLYEELLLKKLEILCYIEDVKGFTMSLENLRKIVSELHNTSVYQMDDVVRAQIYCKPAFMCRVQQYYFNLLFVAEDEKFFYYPTHVVNGNKSYVKDVYVKNYHKTLSYHQKFAVPTLVIAPRKSKNSDR